MKDRFQCDKGLDITLPVVSYDTNRFSMPKWYQTNTLLFVVMLACVIAMTAAIIILSVTGG